MIAKHRHPVRLATVQVYLFGRAIRRLARQAERDMAEAGIVRDPRLPILDDWADLEEVLNPDGSFHAADMGTSWSRERPDAK